MRNPQATLLIANHHSMFTSNLVGDRLNNIYIRQVGHFSVVLQQCTNRNLEMADHISMKFCRDDIVICQIGTCLTIKLYLPQSQIAGPFTTAGSSNPGWPGNSGYIQVPCKARLPPRLPVPRFESLKPCLQASLVCRELCMYRFPVSHIFLHDSKLLMLV